MNRCPKCGATGQLTLTPVFAAKPAGSYSLAGVQDKTAAVGAARLSCAACGWWATGRVDGLRVAGDGAITGGHLVIDQRPPTSSPAGHPAGDGAITGGHLVIDQRPPTSSPAGHPAGEAPTLSRDESPPRRYWSAALGRHVTIPDNEDGPR
jgi:hypothetical protein